MGDNAGFPDSTSHGGAVYVGTVGMPTRESHQGITTSLSTQVAAAPSKPGTTQLGTLRWWIEGEGIRPEDVGSGQ